METSNDVLLVDPGLLQQAEQICRQRLKNDPDNRAVLRSLAEVSRKQGKLEEAIEHGKAAVKSDPKDAMAQGSLGMLMAETEPEEAIEHLKIACDLDPKIFEFQFMLKRLLAKHPSREVNQ